MSVPRDRASDPPPAAQAPASEQGARRRVSLREQARSALDAIRLTELGARAGLVHQVTGLEKAAANRLYRELHGVPSPAGQLPFTDEWFVRDDRRMLHAAIVWRLHGALSNGPRSPARALIDLYESYCSLVVEPLLDLTRAAHVPRLVAMGAWHERRCRDCGSPYLAPFDVRERSCPGCRLYHRHRSRGGDDPRDARARRAGRERGGGRDDDRGAATAREPVHRWERRRSGPTPSGRAAMLALVGELFPHVPCEAADGVDEADCAEGGTS
jgi:hypothetical protein